MLVRNNHYIDTEVYRKKTNTDIYVNWNSFEPNSWKWVTFRTLVTRPSEICSTDKFLEEEIEYARAVFYHQNNYPLLVIDKIIHKMKKNPQLLKWSMMNVETSLLPYKGDKGILILRLMGKDVRKLLQKKSTLQITYTGKFSI